jgi:hypothetical protein
VSEEIKTLITFIRHIELVRRRLVWLSHQLEERAQLHDLSKFREDEFEGFVEINQIARKFKYGSPEYKASIKTDAVSLHYSRNTHHPEYHPDGVDGMNLLDFIEMVADWKAASETYGQTSFEDSLAIQVDRFRLTPEQVYLVRMIAALLVGK